MVWNTHVQDKIARNGSRGELRTEAILVDNFRVLKRNVDVDGADFLVEAIGNDLTVVPFKKQHGLYQLGIVQAKYFMTFDQEIKLKKNYVVDPEGRPNDYFFLMAHTSSAKEDIRYFFTAEEILENFRERGDEFVLYTGRIDQKFCNLSSSAIARIINKKLSGLEKDAFQSLTAFNFQENFQKLSKGGHCKESLSIEAINIVSNLSDSDIALLKSFKSNVVQIEGHYTFFPLNEFYAKPDGTNDCFFIDRAISRKDIQFHPEVDFVLNPKLYSNKSSGTCIYFPDSTRVSMMTISLDQKLFMFPLSEGKSLIMLGFTVEGETLYGEYKNISSDFFRRHSDQDLLNPHPASAQKSQGYIQCLFSSEDIQRLQSLGVINLSSRLSLVIAGELSLKYFDEITTVSSRNTSKHSMLLPIEITEAGQQIMNVTESIKSDVYKHFLACNLRAHGVEVTDFTEDGRA